MKKLIIISFLLLLICFSGTALAIPIGGVEFPDGAISFADAVISYNPTDNVLGDHRDPTNALGIPDFANDSNYVSLGHGGDIVLQFTDNSLTTSGDDS